MKPAQGFAAETSTAATILASSHLGFALSTTQVASGSVIGSGLGGEEPPVRWRAVAELRPGGSLLLPSAAIVGAAAAFIAHLGTVGIIIDSVLGAFVIFWIFWRSSRNKVDAGNAINVPDVAESGYAVRQRKGKVKPSRSDTGSIEPLTPAARSAIRADHASKAAEQAAKRAEAEIEAADRAAAKVAEAEAELFAARARALEERREAERLAAEEAAARQTGNTPESGEDTK